MRLARNFVITLLLLALVAIGVAGVMMYLPDRAPNAARIHELAHRYVIRINGNTEKPVNGLFLISLALVLGSLLALVLSLIPSKRRISYGIHQEMSLEMPMGEGRVKYLESEIRRYIRACLLEFPGVDCRTIEFHRHRSGLGAKVFAVLNPRRTVENVQVLQRRMVERVRRALAEDLGIPAVGEISVATDFEEPNRTDYRRTDEVPASQVLSELRPEAALPADAAPVVVTQPISVTVAEPAVTPSISENPGPVFQPYRPTEQSQPVLIADQAVIVSDPAARVETVVSAGVAAPSTVAVTPAAPAEMPILPSAEARETEGREPNPAPAV